MTTHSKLLILQDAADNFWVPWYLTSEQLIQLLRILQVQTGSTPDVTTTGSPPDVTKARSPLDITKARSPPDVTKTLTRRRTPHLPPLHRRLPGIPTLALQTHVISATVEHAARPAFDSRVHQGNNEGEARPTAAADSNTADNTALTRPLRSCRTFTLRTVPAASIEMRTRVLGCHGGNLFIKSRVLLCLVLQKSCQQQCHIR
ncbi:unnamed protein product [Zymoseptoria tritici ST99CH_3D7]|uniref:Uncharacterized protein n=1 Tax=Zymoseptoria tritici (strain ST99CH_3D7) TaxID=1276538 RepID=A0A1X7SA58_ZYMT9|nr:unnamed protein product [Zymoseptoria tritici ST99CH_3D7]